jgi:hypothetical protein
MNNLTVRNLKEEDYKTLSDWWTFWWGKPVERYALPDDLSEGILILKNDIPICSGFIYRTSSSSLFWIEFIISNNEIKDKELRDSSLDYLLQVLLELCKRAGAKTIFTSVKHPSLIKKYIKNGFTKGDDGMTNFIYNFN